MGVDIAGLGALRVLKPQLLELKREYTGKAELFGRGGRGFYPFGAGRVDGRIF